MCRWSEALAVVAPTTHFSLAPATHVKKMNRLGLNGVGRIRVDGKCLGVVGLFFVFWIFYFSFK